MRCPTTNWMLHEAKTPIWEVFLTSTISSESSEKFVTQIYLKLFRHSKILSSLSATAAKFMGVKRIKIAITHVNCELRQGSWQEHG